MVVARVQLGVEVVETHAAAATDQQIGLRGFSTQPRHQIGFGVVLDIAVVENGHRRYAELDDLVDQSLHAVAADIEHRHLGHIRQCSQFGIAGSTGELVVAWVDQEQLTLIAASDECVQQPGTDTARSLRHTDQCHRARIQQRFEAVRCGHGQVSER